MPVTLRPRNKKKEEPFQQPPQNIRRSTNPPSNTNLASNKGEKKEDRTPHLEPSTPPQNKTSTPLTSENTSKNDFTHLPPKNDAITPVSLPQYKEKPSNTEWDSETAKNHLKNNWTNPASPVSFLGNARINKFYKGVLKLDDIKNVLATIDSWSLMKQTKKSRKNLNRFPAYYLNDFWMADSIDVSELKDFNYGIKHLFSVIDVFSRKAYVIPLTSNKAVDGIEALKKIITMAGEFPQNFGSDKGSECGSFKVQTFLKSIGVNPVILSGPSKAANVESFQKSLQKMIYSFISENDNLTFIPFLPLIVNSYNERIHTKTKYAPNLILKSVSIQIELEKKNMKIKMNNVEKKKKPSLKIGDWVRISSKKSPFHRSYNTQNTYERFQIYKIQTSFLNPRYFIKEEDGSVIEGAFDRSELVRVNLNTYKASVIKRKNSGGKKYALVDYKGYAPKYRQWVLDEEKS